MDRERPGWYQSSEEPDSDARAEQTPEAHGEREEAQRREPSWRRRDKYDPFERLRRRRAQAEAERAERAEQAERAERAEAQRRSPSGGAPAGNPYADQPLAGPWGDGSAQETIAGDYPVIANDPKESKE